MLCTKLFFQLMEFKVSITELADKKRLSSFFNLNRGDFRKSASEKRARNNFFWSILSLYYVFFDNVAIIFVNSANDFDCIMFKKEVTFVNKFSAWGKILTWNQRRRQSVEIRLPGRRHAKGHWRNFALFTWAIANSYLKIQQKNSKKTWQCILITTSTHRQRKRKIWR